MGLKNPNSGKTLKTFISVLTLCTHILNIYIYLYSVFINIYKLKMYTSVYILIMYHDMIFPKFLKKLKKRKLTTT